MQCLPALWPFAPGEQEPQGYDGFALAPRAKGECGHPRAFLTALPTVFSPPGGHRPRAPATVGCGVDWSKAEPGREYDTDEFTQASRPPGLTLPPHAQEIK